MAQYTTTYTTLVALVEDYVEDDSAELSGAIQGAINRAEERILRDLDLVYFNRYASGTTSAGVPTFTKSFTDSHVHTICLTATKTFLQRRTRDFVDAYGGTGAPIYFYEDQTTVRFAPTPDTTYDYQVSYINRPTPLSASNTTNWLTTNAADALLWATLVEAESFLIAPERVQEYEMKYQQMMGPLRGLWRHVMQTAYEPVNPTPTPTQTR